MPDINFVTFCTSDYLIQAASLIDSIINVHEESIVYFVGLDKLSKNTIAQKHLFNKNIKVIDFGTLDDLIEEKQISERPFKEKIFALKPVIISKILDFIPEENFLIYCDSDLFFYRKFSSSDGMKSILLTKHKFANHLSKHQTYGIYNAGLVGFRNNEVGKSILEWWKIRCLESTDLQNKDGIYGDQKYLEYFSNLTDEISIEDNYAINQGMWSISSDELILSGPKICNQELQCFHFHGLKLSKFLIKTGISRYGKLRNEKDIFKYIYQPYLEVLRQNKKYGKSKITIPVRWLSKGLQKYEYRIF